MRRRAFTLAEVMVAGALFSLILSLVVVLLRPGYRAWVKGAHKSEVQQNCLVAMTRLVQEFQYAHAGSVSVQHVTAVDDDGHEVARDSVIFLSNLDHDGNLDLTPDGDPKWPRRLALYHDGPSNQVRSLEIPQEPPVVDPEPLLVPTFTQAASDRIVARHIRVFKLDYDAPPRLGIVVEAQSDGYTSHYETSVLPLMVTFIQPTPTPSPSPSPSPGG